MKNFVLFLAALLLFTLFNSCSDARMRSATAGQLADGESRLPEFSKDLDEIKKDGKLRVLIAYSGTSYFLYRGKPMGYEYELLQHLADYLDLELEIIVSKDLDMLLTDLANGDADMVAYGLAITFDRKKIAAFTDYLYLTKQVLVQKKPENWRQMTLDNIKKSIVQDPLGLIDDTVSVRKNSSYVERLDNLSKEMGGKIVIDTLNGNLSTEEIIQMVAEGNVKYTIADKNLARVVSSYFPILDTEVPVSFSQRIAWAVRPSSPKLLEAVNEWIREYKGKHEFNVIYNKYFENERSFKRRVQSKFYTLNSNEISPYDPLIKTNAERIDWDWRLLASLIYQESRFKNEATSWTGAAGLMQMMPGTAEDMKVANSLDPEDNIRGGTRYLNGLYHAFDDITDSIQRIKFTLASYNCGLSHVKDAQTLAKMNNLDPNVWDGQVDQMILDLSYPKNYNKKEIQFGYVNGREPYNYVKDIFDRYDHYVRFIDQSMAMAEK